MKVMFIIVFLLLFLIFTLTYMYLEKKYREEKADEIMWFLILGLPLIFIIITIIKEIL